MKVWPFSRKFKPKPVIIYEFDLTGMTEEEIRHFGDIFQQGMKAIHG
jgi:hypothetical protein